MNLVFFGYASVFNVLDGNGDIVEHGAFTDFLNAPDHLNIPLLNAHDHDLPLGRWLDMQQDETGLFVVGELYEGISFDEPFPGISIGSGLGQAAPFPTPAGGHFIRVAHPNEISLLTHPKNPQARVLGIKMCEPDEPRNWFQNQLARG
ncbi:HK97 family phage prohead protease [Ensifer canadensis]